MRALTHAHTASLHTLLTPLSQQANFMRQRTRIVVATVAFGLGVDMSTVRSVVHYDMPTSVEGYVQEIGRAGRDGMPARCHLLLCDSDFTSHHSLAHSNCLEAAQLRGLLHAVFAAAATTNSSNSTVTNGSTSTTSSSSSSVGGSSSGGDKSAAAATTAADGDADTSSSSSTDASDSINSGSQATAVPAAAAAAALAAAPRQTALCIADLENKLDMKAEVIETVLSLLEGAPYSALRLHGTVDDRLEVS
jgi:superfamily II DNA/RNA helicase